jgi:7-cyano-7-deazaguanine reductase
MKNHPPCDLEEAPMGGRTWHRGSYNLNRSEEQTLPTAPSKSLEVFPNPRPDREYEISFECPEFTCLCPRTGQPDFATIRIVYTPDALCVELKSLKLYLWSYRNEGAFHEEVVNRILDDLVKSCEPRRMRVAGDFLIRGGIHTIVTATHPDQ